MKPLTGLAAIVTGGARGIGAATARELARMGADVAIADLRLGEGAETLAGEIRSMGRTACLVEADVAFAAQCRRLVDDSVAQLGRVDILVNNAGGSLGFYANVEEVTEEDYDRVFAVNLKGSFFTTQAAVPHMRTNGGGRIINLASELAFLGYELMVPYCASKGGVIAMTRSLARALAPDILVNAVAPGATATERFKGERWYAQEKERREADILLRRFGEPEEIARTITFLAGPGAGYCTGQTFNVNGGVVMP